MMRERGTYMGKYRYLPGAGLFALALIAMITEEVPAWLSLVILAAAAIALIIASRGTIYFTRGVKKVKDGKREEALALFEKALDLGLSNSYQSIAATVLLQEGDAEKGRKYLEPLVKVSDTKLRSNAEVSLSMYYWLSGDIDKAISLCEDARSIGCRDRNLYINLCTYYLADKRVNEFREMLKEYGTKGAASPSFVDFHAVSGMLRGDWKNAGSYLEALFESMNPDFADPYVHFAEVYLHYGELAKARKMLELAKKTEFGRFSVYSVEMIDEMLRAVSDPAECVAFAEAAEKNVLRIVNGKLPLAWKTPEAKICREDVIPGFPAMPSFSGKPHDADEDADDGFVNTEITDDDEEWLRRHQEK